LSVDHHDRLNRYAKKATRLNRRMQSLFSKIFIGKCNVCVGYCRIGAKSKGNFGSAECIDSIDSNYRAKFEKSFLKPIDFFGGLEDKNKKLIK
jgi:hypothetical protein